MSENKMKQRRRQRRRSAISMSSHTGIDDDTDSLIKMFDINDVVEDVQIHNNEEDNSTSPFRDARGQRRRETKRRINEEMLLQKINECKGIIENVKTKAWPMSRKLLVHQKARMFVEESEGQLPRGQGYQQRGKQIMKHVLRTLSNWWSLLLPWETQIKRIESHFGSVVVSYFVFLRWLLWISLWLAVLPTCFVMVPELLAGGSYGSSDRKTIPDDELETAYDLKTIWDAEGIVKYSVLFYGYYGNSKTIGQGYRLPLAYLLTNLVAFLYSFIAVLKIMTKNSRHKQLSTKGEEFTFTWTTFTEWDYMIGSHDTALTKHASIATTFKEAIMEEQAKVKDSRLNKWLIWTRRVVANIVILLLLALSAYIIQLFVERSRDLEIKKRDYPSYTPGFWEENELTLVVTAITSIFPPILEILSPLEKLHPRLSLRLMLARIFILNLLNLYTLFIALYNKQNDLMEYLAKLVRNETSSSNCSSLTNSLPDTTATTHLPQFADGSQNMTGIFADSSQNMTAIFADSSQNMTAIFADSSQNMTAIFADSSQNMTAIFADSSQNMTAIFADSSQNMTAIFAETILGTTLSPGEAMAALDCANLTGVPASVKEFCWETMIGQEVFKLTVLDTVFMLGQILLQDVLRTYFVRYCSALCCWDLEKHFPEYPEFKTAENLLALINNQGVVWLGAFFNPGLPLLNLGKLLVLMYVRCWTVLVYTVPEERIFRASRSNNFYYTLLLIMLFLCMLPPLFAIVTVQPSPHCGPFSGQSRIYDVLTDTLRTELSHTANYIIQYVASPGVILPVLVLLGMLIYYLISVTRALRDANCQLLLQLEYERTEGRRRVYAMADAKHCVSDKSSGQSWKVARSQLDLKGHRGNTQLLSAAAASVVDSMPRTKRRLADLPPLSSTTSAANDRRQGQKVTRGVKQQTQTFKDVFESGQQASPVPLVLITGAQSPGDYDFTSNTKNKLDATSEFGKAQNRHNQVGINKQDGQVRHGHGDVSSTREGRAMMTSVSEQHRQPLQKGCIDDSEDNDSVEDLGLNHERKPHSEKQTSSTSRNILEKTSGGNPRQTSAFPHKKLLGVARFIHSKIRHQLGDGKRPYLKLQKLVPRVSIAKQLNRYRIHRKKRCVDADGKLSTPYRPSSVDGEKRYLTPLVLHDHGDIDDAEARTEFNKTSILTSTLKRTSRRQLPNDSSQENMTNTAKNRPLSARIEIIDESTQPVIYSGVVIAPKKTPRQWLQRSTSNGSMTGPPPEIILEELNSTPGEDSHRIGLKDKKLQSKINNTEHQQLHQEGNNKAGQNYVADSYTETSDQSEWSRERKQRVHTPNKNKTRIISNSEIVGIETDQGKISSEGDHSEVFQTQALKSVKPNNATEYGKDGFKHVQPVNRHRQPEDGKAWKGLLQGLKDARLPGDHRGAARSGVGGTVVALDDTNKSTWSEVLQKVNSRRRVESVGNLQQRMRYSLTNRATILEESKRQHWKKLQQKIYVARQLNSFSDIQQRARTGVANGKSMLNAINRYQREVPLQNNNIAEPYDSADESKNILH